MLDAVFTLNDAVHAVRPGGSDTAPPLARALAHARAVASTLSILRRTFSSVAFADSRRNGNSTGAAKKHSSADLILEEGLCEDHDRAKQEIDDITAAMNAVVDEYKKQLADIMAPTMSNAAVTKTVNKVKIVGMQNTFLHYKILEQKKKAGTDVFLEVPRACKQFMDDLILAAQGCNNEDNADEHACMAMHETKTAARYRLAKMSALADALCEARLKAQCHVIKYLEKVGII